MTHFDAPKVKPIIHRLIGLDYGLARIGIALSDERQFIASPLITFVCEKKIEDTVIKLINQISKHAEDNKYIIEEIVIGLPLMMSGKKGMIADEVIHFVELLRQKTTIPISTWDERLTTVQADRSLREGSMSRKKRSRVVDVVAACIILQNFLDHKSIKRSQESQVHISDL
ncbi:MAG: Holliday junction resolvase RuvX [Parachlamydiaceae bacterium]|nr:Holliday junction resolvase RuvX [Parachlamydiaceae bacterium]